MTAKRGRPPLVVGQPTKELKLRLPLKVLVRLKREAKRMGYLHGGRAAPGTLARDVLEDWLEGEIS